MEESESRIQALLAYADGQLTPAQSAEIEVTLTEEERSFIRQEKQFVKTSSTLLADQDVPENVWKNISGQIRSTEAQKVVVPQSVSGWRRSAWVLSAAALVAAVIGLGWLFYPQEHDEVAAFLQHSQTATVAELRKEAASAGDLDAVAALLKHEGLTVDFSGLRMLLMKPKMGGHETYLLGAKPMIVNGDTCVVLLFQCCGQPTQIVLGHKGSAVDVAMHRYAKQTEGRALNLTERDIGEVCAMFVGAHDARGLLMLLG